MSDDRVVHPVFLPIEREALVALLTVRIRELERACAALPFRSARYDAMREVLHHCEMARLRLTQDPAEAARLGVVAPAPGPADSQNGSAER